MPLMPDLQCLWQQPDQAGVLRKHSHGMVTGWQERFFVLKGSNLYYFKTRHHSKSLHGVIPLEQARHAYIAKHPYYVLLAPTPEVHAVWIAALSQAAIPRASLLSHLKRVDALEEMLREFDDQTKLCFPTMGTAVISSSACVRMDDQQPLVHQESTHRSSLALSESLAGAEDRAIPSLKIQPSFIVRSSQATRTTTQRASVPAAHPDNEGESKPATAPATNDTAQLIEPNRRSLRAVFGTTAMSPTVEVIA